MSSPHQDSSSSLLPSAKSSAAHPLASFLTEEDYQLAELSRKKDEKRDEEYQEEIQRRTHENRELMNQMVPVGLDRENKSIKERKKKLKQDAFKRYQRDTSGTRVRTRDEFKWQLRRKKKNRSLDVNALRWQEENRKRQLLHLAENDIVRDANIATGVEIDEDDFQASTLDLTQTDMLQEADQNTKAKIFHLTLPFSAQGYHIAYTSSGRHIVIHSSTGYVASVEWKSFKLMHENETGKHIGNAVWMMDDTMYCLSSQKTPSVYNDLGEHIHLMPEFKGCTHVEYLRYHFAIAGGHPSGSVFYKDISIGDEATRVRVKPITAMCQNPFNGIIICGHPDGQISMVTPRDKDMEPVVSMLCHNTPVQKVAVDISGTYMVTCSKEGITKVWEIKKSFKQIARYRSPAAVSAIAISQNGMVALGIRNQVLVWKHPSQLSKKKIYLKHTVQGKALVTSLAFCPYEDVLGIGRSNGVSHMLVPGSGMSEFDTRAANPLSTDATTKNLNVDMLLEKVPLDMISLDPDVIGTSGVKQKAYKFDHHVKLSDHLKEELNTLGIKEKEERKKLSEMTREELREQKEKKDQEFKAGLQEWYEDEAPNPLDRFASKGKRKRILMEQAEKKQQEEEEAGEASSENEEDSSSSRKTKRARLEAEEEADEEENAGDEEEAPDSDEGETATSADDGKARTEMQSGEDQGDSSGSDDDSSSSSEDDEEAMKRRNRMVAFAMGDDDDESSSDSE